MDLKNLFKNDYVKLAIFAVLAYLAYRTFFVVREGWVDNQGPGGSMGDSNLADNAYVLSDGESDPGITDLNT